MKRGLNFVFKVCWLYLGFVLCVREILADDSTMGTDLVGSELVAGDLSMVRSCNVSELTEAARSLLRDLEPVAFETLECDACKCGDPLSSACFELQASRARAREQRLARIEAVVAECERALAEAAK